MGDTNKVLAVSYGTFSCRLEGFDDSVETMKTVVSYFHELAGHDRFMDMEPQAPDMDTLTRLAEEQTGTPVQAEVDGERISLRVRPASSDATPDAEERPSLRLHPRTDDSALTDDVQDADGDLTEEAFEDIETDTADIEDDNVEEDVDSIILTSNEADDVASYEEDTPAAASSDDGVYNDLADDGEAVIADGDDTEDEDEDDAPFFDPATQDDQSDASDSVAAKLQRIRAVVSRGHMAASPDTFAEDLNEPAETPKPAAENPLSQRLADLAQRNATIAHDDVADEAAIQDEDLSEHEELSTEELAEFEAEDDVQDAAPDTSSPLVLTSDEAETEEDLVAEDVLLDTPDVEELAEDDDQNLVDDVAEANDEAAMRRLNRSKRSDLPENNDEAMKRILTQADEKLNEPEGRRHRDAFAQLKAAVAATEAARQLGDPGAATRETSEAFRNDLGAHEAAESKSGSRPLSTPLKLVASLRVEGEEEEEAEAPLDQAADRLRQIAAKKEGGSAGTGGFAEFAKQKGATELADLLEAAAAYIAFVEGDDDFSRPQVMKKVQMASSDQFSREDGLRSFGRLLRQSKIIKLNNGRFQVAEDTRFRPEDKAAQG